MSKNNSKNPINILHVCSGDLWAGAEVMVFNLLSQLIDYPNIRITVLSLNEGILTNKLQKIGIETYTIPENSNSFMKICWKAFRLLRGRNFDIIHAHRYKENMLAFILYKLLLAKYLFTTFHGWGVEYFEEKKGTGRRLTTRINYFLIRHFFTSVVPVSYDIRNVLVQQYGFKENRTIVVHNGIVIPQKTRSTGKTNNQKVKRTFHIGSVGRLMPQKDYGLFLEIAANVIKRMENIRFSILGDGPLKEWLVQKAKYLNIEDYIEILPPRENPYPYYYSLDIYLNTSLFEGIPLTILEAMACNILVVASSVGGIPEIINNERNGILIDSRDPVVYAEKCIFILNNHKLRNLLAGSAGQTIEKHFSTKHMTESYLNLYNL